MEGSRDGPPTPTNHYVQHSGVRETLPDVRVNAIRDVLRLSSPSNLAPVLTNDLRGKGHKLISPWTH